MPDSGRNWRVIVIGLFESFFDLLRFLVVADIFFVLYNI